MTLAGLAMLPLLEAWNFVVYPDSMCESTPSGTPDGDGDSGCEPTPENHRCFEISNMGNCELYLFATEDDCEDGDAQNSYGAADEDEPIPPDYQWDAYYVIC